MNANWQVKTNKEWLAEATAALTKVGVSSPRLDALLLLCGEWHQTKSWVLAHPERQLRLFAYHKLEKKFARRLQHEPMAYIRGYQEFYGREFIVSPDVLIPRPESESLIELLATLPHDAGDMLIDVGTGSGALAVTAKLELPELTVRAVDISDAALVVAAQNARTLEADVTCIKADLLEGQLAKSAQFVVANLPYVATDWERSPETNFEPELALFAEDNGLALIEKLIPQAARVVKPRGYLLLEADPRQHQRISEVAAAHGFTREATDNFALCFIYTPQASL